jgi:hypothetical protein
MLVVFVSVHFCVSTSSADWKFAAEQFVKRLPGKVFVHREFYFYS